MKRFMTLAALALLATGCNLKTTTYSDEQAIPLAEGQTDSLILSVSIEYPVKGAGEDILTRIEEGILSAAFIATPPEAAVASKHLRSLCTQSFLLGSGILKFRTILVAPLNSPLVVVVDAGEESLLADLGDAARRDLDQPGAGLVRTCIPIETTLAGRHRGNIRPIASAIGRE